MNTILMEKLGSLMKTNGITTLELAKATNISTNSILRIKDGTYQDPTISTVITLANFFDLTVSEFIDEKKI